MKVGVVGAGIFGIAAALALRERGHAVAVFDQGPVPHPHASSTDVAKAIRRTSYASANDTYVELVERAARQWREWQTRFGTTVYHRTGGLTILPSFAPGSPMYESWRYPPGARRHRRRGALGAGGSRSLSTVHRAGR